MPPRTQAQRSDATTALLVNAARELFGTRGFAATALEEIAAATGTTKGAIYHHFSGKNSIFRAALTAEAAAIATTLEQVAATAPSAWEALRLGCRTFLEHCLDPGFRRIVILDGPAVLGWDSVREIEHGTMLRVLVAGFEVAAAEGVLTPGDPTVRAQLMFGALCEGGMLLARSQDPAGDLELIATEVDALLSAFRGPR
ncbi:TetR/AcrR family transcriptional regulator [Nonomuraea sp. NPDC050328]|uniref:TetR/AcrR family transcriptional regulator n=1 Tax=Nonomuraea sp. NPDC050328 TaxID=3364361 RepID=UPI0037ADBDD9